MKIIITPITSALILGALLALTANTGLASSGKITWSQPFVAVDATWGTAHVQEIELSVERQIGPVSIAVTPSIGSLVSVSPDTFETLLPGEAYTVQLIITADAGTRAGIHAGTIHLKAGKATVANPLPLWVSVPKGGRDGADEASPREQVLVLEQAGMIPALDRSPDIQGPDTDMNGIRDDVEAHINTLPLAPAQRQGVAQFAKAVQRTLLVDVQNPAAVREASVAISVAIQCLSIRFPDVRERAAIAAHIESITVNTQVRSEQYIKFNNALSGSALRLLSGNTCDGQ